MNPYNPENPAQPENPGQTSNPTNPEPKEPQFIGGPQFEQTGGWGKKVSDWLGKYGSTVILPIIAILILVGGVYLYTSQKATETAFIGEKMPQLTEEGAISEETEAEAEVELPSPEELTITAGEEGIQEIITQPERKAGAKVWTEKAEPGDGVTHLARRALKDYLAKQPREDLTLEHKIYIEDYLKDKTGSQPLEIGDEVSFSEDLIEEAIDASLNLTPNQIENLKQYSALVTSW